MSTLNSLHVEYFIDHSQNDAGLDVHDTQPCELQLFAFRRIVAAAASRRVAGLAWCVFKMRKHAVSP